ncbi:acyltransferase family protein, partial [Paenirhodobacter enshiensis]|uniref:acyltransferase family protein n=1 Tax=Paenirhodobacter enshiensis TaxID=1105367 RepID=UPI003FA2F21D
VRQLYLGVPLFSVTSGYCTSATDDSTRLKGRGCATYFRRRFRRIFPPYWIFLGLVLALSLGAAGVGGAPGGARKASPLPRKPRARPSLKPRPRLTATMRPRMPHVPRLPRRWPGSLCRICRSGRLLRKR